MISAPAITIRKVHNMAPKTRKRIGLIITNSQNMYICDISLLLQYLTPFEQMFIISSILTAAESSSNDILRCCK